MPPAPYSFIDVAILDGVRERFAAGDAVIILSVDLDELIWANGPGAMLFGHSDIEAIGGADSGLSYAARRQIMATGSYPHIGRDRSVVVRIAKGLESKVHIFLASEISMPDGEEAIMLVEPVVEGDEANPETIARGVSGFTEPGHLAAFVDGNGGVEASCVGFAALGISPRTLGDLVTEAGRADGRIVRKIIPAGTKSLPAGIARLRDDPARHLLVVVDEQPVSDRPEPPRFEPVAAVSPAATVEIRQADFAPSAQAPAIGVADPDGLGAATGKPNPGNKPAPDDEQPSLFDGAPVSNDAGHIDGTTPVEPSDAGDVTRAEPPATHDPAPVEPSPRNTPSTPDPPPPDAQLPDERTTPAASLPESAHDVALLLPEERAASPLRFVWRTDANGNLGAISPEFLEAVGADATQLTGRPFKAVSDMLGLDPYGEISGLLARRDTWSGRSVFWPIAGTDLRVPVDLAALPVYARDRSFEGFRGFGVARMGDAVVDPEALGMDMGARSSAVADAPEADEFMGEVPALRAAPPHAAPPDKVIRLAEHRTVTPEKALSSVERSAFREIGERLRKDGKSLETDTPDAPGSGRAEADDEGMIPRTFGRRTENPTTETRDDKPFIERRRANLPTGTEPVLPPPAPPLDQPGMRAAEPQAPLPPVAAAERNGAAETRAAPSRPSTAELKIDGFVPSAFSGPSAEVRKPFQETAILSRLPVPLLIHSGDVLHYANEEFLALTGYDNVRQLAEAGGLDALFAQAYGDDGAQDGEDRAIRLKTRDGLEFAIEALLRSVPWKGGKALMLVVRRTGDDEAPVAAAAPVTPEAAAPSIADQTTLKSRVAEMRTIIDTATDGVILISNDGAIRSISRPAEALFGFDTDELAGKPFVSLFAIESQRAARDYLAGLSDNGVASVLNDGREVIGREAQGRFIPLFMTIGKLPNESGYCAVVRDITQWKRAEEELTQARSIAERASSHKTDFLARVSHEIRTPLNAIIGFSELMVDERFGPIANDRYRDYLRDINRSGNHVLDLVNDLLDITKIEAGEQEMDYEAVSLNDALGETVAMMQPQANRERVIIRSSFASSLPEVVADLRSIRQIALNILSNAVRYTQAGGQVIVSTSHEPSGDVVMRVRDTGIGMSPAEIEHALKPFKQVNSVKRGRGDGTGLGLPLTKAMVEANRARFAINSTPGEGTLVEVTFPSTRVLVD